MHTHMTSAIVLALSVLATTTNGQTLKPQTNTFNSNFTLSSKQIAPLNLSSVIANNINIATQFERTNWATGSVFDDPFYTKLPTNATSAPAGSLLKVEAFTNTCNYTIAPTLALSRIIYQSKTLNGSLVPVSAYVLWPYLPRGGHKVAPLVSWGHGTSGIYPECAPSHVRNLWYQFSTPYSLALAGYAVVGTDYAGLGVPFYPDGKNITHQYGASPAAGNDLLYAAQAAHAAFPNYLSRDFVIMGHSQGGGAAWAAAQQQVSAKVPGYLGSIAAAPVTDSFELFTTNKIGLFQVARGISLVYPELSISRILTDTGVKLMNLISDIQGCNSVFATAIVGLVGTDFQNPKVDLVKNEFADSSYSELWANLTTAGGKDFQGPMLVLQGMADNILPEHLTTKYVNKTCERYPHNELQYVKVKGVSHVPVMFAAQQIWLEWLDRRFSKQGSANNKGKCSQQEIGSNAPRPLSEYQGDLNYFLEYSLDSYQVA